MPARADIGLDGKQVAMVWAEEAITVASPCEVVFALVTDVPRMPAWRSTLVEAAWDDEGPSQIGRRMRAVTRVAGRRFAWSCEVTEWDPPWAFGYVASGVGDNHHEVSVRFDLEPIPSGCRLTMAGGGKLPGRIAGIAAPLFVRLFMRENRMALKRLKTLAKGSHTAGS